MRAKTREEKAKTWAVALLAAVAIGGTLSAQSHPLFVDIGQPDWGQTVFPNQLDPVVITASGRIAGTANGDAARERQGVGRGR